MKKATLAIVLLSSLILSACSGFLRESVSEEATSKDSDIQSQILESSHIGLEENLLPVVLTVEELPFANHIVPKYTQSCFAWMQGGEHSLIIPSSPDETRRDTEGIDFGESGSDVIITSAQQEYVIDQLMEIAKKYRTGEYPIIPGEYPDYTPYSAPWPPNTPMEINVQSNEIFYCTLSSYMYFQLGLYLMLDEEWLMCAFISPDVSAVNDEFAEDFWDVNTDYFFINSSGEVLNYRSYYDTETGSTYQE